MKMDEKKPPRSYMVGIIALMFLLIGYQTALFVHRAAVTSMAVAQDEPDTVYVIQQVSEMSGKTTKSSASKSLIVRKNADHSPVVQTVRMKTSKRKAESFRFDPNTVSIEELCRLGFTSRQAQSIDNYRKKGGRFHRKSDFAESYVVSDSVYKRLEPYIDIPLLDLNLADSASLDALPGIGGWYASAIIKHRIALRGYSDKRQLMDIRGFDQERYDALKDLVTVEPENVAPYPLWNYPADSLRNHPYIKTYAIAKAIVLYRKNNPVNRLTVKGLLEAGIISNDVADRLSLCKITPP